MKIFKPLAAAALLAAASAAPAHAEITLTMGGDMNFNASRVGTRPDGAEKGGHLYPFSSLLAGIRPYIDGDLNFANVETVVTDRMLPNTNGTFVFATHPNAIRAAIDAGFNFFNLCNNHAGDHGLEGLEETLKNFESFSSNQGIDFGGVAANRAQALTPKIFEVRTPSGQYRIAFLALTAPANQFEQAGPNRTGVLYLRDPRDVKDALAAMRSVQADYKIVSLHGGTEGVMKLDAGQQSLYERILNEGDVDLIIGHHPHRVRPIEHYGYKVIFYSLGNYLMLGAANINGLPDLADYGLLAKLHLQWDESRQRLVAQAAEAVPLYDMQLQTKPLSPAEAARRVRALNQLGDQQLGTRNVNFRVNDRGPVAGYACLGDKPGVRAAKVCAAASQ